MKQSSHSLPAAKLVTPFIKRAPLAAAVIAAAGLMTACSSSDSSGPADASISGVVAAAPVNGASIMVKDASGNELVDAVTTAADGSYSVTLAGADFTGTLVFEATGGTYNDEATGASTDAGTLSAYVDVASLTGTEVQITPASTIVHDMVVDHGVDLATALASFDEAFGFDANDDAAPADATAPAADATEEELLAGLRAAAFSQLTDDLGLTPAEQFDLLSALAEDLADGELDGEANGADVMITTAVGMPVDIQNRFVTALLNFHNDGLTGMMGDPASGNDMTGLDNSQIGMLPFPKVALTGLTAGAYKVEYIPGMMDAMQGKTEFTLRISDDSGNAVTGSMVMTMFVMNMEDRRHSTPDVDCEEDIVIDGDYYCTVYYVMPSVMPTGDSMGFWQVKVTVDSSQTAIFYPMVNMAMGDTTRVLLRGIDPVDTISMDGDVVSRPYNLFRNRLEESATSGHDFELFIAPMETMMSFPALATYEPSPPLGTLNSTFVIYDVKVEFSTDPTNALSWTEATYTEANGNGIWGITGLAGVTDKIYVKLYVDSDDSGIFDADELKTVNGKQEEFMTDFEGKVILDGEGNPIPNTYTFFNVTP